MSPMSRPSAVARSHSALNIKNNAPHVQIRGLESYYERVDLINRRKAEHDHRAGRVSVQGKNDFRLAKVSELSPLKSI